MKYFVISLVEKGSTNSLYKRRNRCWFRALPRPRGLCALKMAHLSSFGDAYDQETTYRYMNYFIANIHPLQRLAE